MSAKLTCFYLHTEDTVAPPQQRIQPEMMPLVVGKEKVKAKEAIEAGAVPPLRKNKIPHLNLKTFEQTSNLKPAPPGHQARLQYRDAHWDAYKITRESASGGVCMWVGLQRTSQMTRACNCQRLWRLIVPPVPPPLLLLHELKGGKQVLTRRASRLACRHCRGVEKQLAIPSLQGQVER